MNLLLILFGFTLIFPFVHAECECGLTLQTRIIRGKEANARQYPWLVAVMTEDEGECGGSLINDRFILTAAHCLIDKPTDGPAELSDKSKTFVMFGAHTANQRVQVEKGQEKVDAEEFFIHENFNSTGNLEDDIALIKLKHPVDVENKWTPICLPRSHHLVAYELFVAGWGITDPYQINSEDRKYADVLYESKINRWNDLLCLRYWDRTEFEPSKQFCAALKTCDGDSGGPVSFISETKKRNVYQVGIVSYGSDDCGYFNRKPDVHTKVSAYLDWIEERTRGSKWCPSCGTPQFTRKDHQPKSPMVPPSTQVAPPKNPGPHPSHPKNAKRASRHSHIIHHHHHFGPSQFHHLGPGHHHHHHYGFIG